MRRRAFLQGLLAAPVVVTTPGLLMPVRAVEWAGPVSIVRQGGIEIDWVNKTIKISKRMSVLDFHRGLQDIIDQPENIHRENPSVRMTDEIIGLENHYRVTDNRSLDELRGGVLRQRAADDEFRKSHNETYLFPGRTFDDE